jgi:ATP-dependent RNA helicase HelY
VTDARDALLARYEFTLDAFQTKALDALDAGDSVLVAAPTGSGKTVVAEYAVGLALELGGKAFYTTPIKALSNQKYGDLVRRHGVDKVGLLTGDNSINGDAPIVVMTTEVLRNMIYAGSPALRGLRFVVLDEVHYLQDAYRGPVWEEVMIHLPTDVRLVCLSATVSNAEELADWITTVRGPTATIIEEARPVDLLNLYLVGDKGSDRLHLLPTLVDGRPNPEASRLDAETLQSRGRQVRRPRRRFFTPRRVEVIERLNDEAMLPALYFIFSRAACNDAVSACLDAGLRLTTPDERAAIREIIDARTAAIADEDLDVLGFDRWAAGLEAGIASHHAGMVPPFKETVEACFAAGLVKAIFATETLALGINMPARSVVIEKLSKFTGERREFLTPGEYTQLTGRAGRRGIDDLGYAVVLWSPFVPFDQVAALASSRTYALRSAFRPTYNMAANLVRRYEPAQAHHLLNLSFAQYQADRAVVRLEARLERQQERLRTLEASAACERGDIGEYRALVRAAEVARRGTSAGRRNEDAIAQLAPGDVIDHGGVRLAVLSVAFRKGGVRMKAVDTKARLVALEASDFDEEPEAVGRLELPVPFGPKDPVFRHDVATLLQRARVTRGSRRHQRVDASSEAIAAVEAHPIAACPDADAHVRAHGEAERVAADVADLTRQVRARTESLARRFDRVLRLMEAWGYLDGWELTERGEVLARTYHECDLLVAEAITSGTLDGLEPAELAGLVSAFTYEQRGPGPPATPWFPSALVRDRYAELERLSDELAADEESAGLPPMRAPDPGFIGIAHAWAAGDALHSVLESEDLSGGDFVRNIRQLLDLLRQVGEIAPEPRTARAARTAADALHRGVVAAASVLEDPNADGPGDAISSA